MRRAPRPEEGDTSAMIIELLNRADQRFQLSLKEGANTIDDIELLLIEQLFADHFDSLGVPVVLILGPPGCGKGTLSKRLAGEYNLHHFSVGDWLRAQTHAPIAEVSDRINEYVYAGEVIPQEMLTTVYSSEEEIPPALLLYNCSKPNISTPTKMWLRALQGLKEAFQEIAQSRSPPAAILLDNFPKTLDHAKAAAEIFGSAFPALVISVTCSEDIACARFLARSRGGDDAGVFSRRFARSAQGMPAVIRYYDRVGPVVEVDGAGQPEEVYGNLIEALDEDETWQLIAGQSWETDDEEADDEFECSVFA